MFSRRKDVSELASKRDIAGLVKVIANDEDQRAAAVDALAGLQDPAVVGPLIESLEAPGLEQETRDAAFEVMRRLGPTIVTDQLVTEMLAGRKVAGWALGALGEPAVPIAKDLAAKGEPSRGPAYFAFASAGTPEAAEALAAGIRSESDRADALLAATNWTGEEAVGIEALFSVIREVIDTPLEGDLDNALLRIAARVRYGMVSGDIALPLLAEKLRSEDVAERAGAAKVLYWVHYPLDREAGPEDAKSDPRTADALAEASRDPEPMVRFNAAAALSFQGDRRATPTIVEMLDSSDEGILKSALAGLQLTRDPAAYDKVRELHERPAREKPSVKTTFLIGLHYEEMRKARETELGDRVPEPD